MGLCVPGAVRAYLKKKKKLRKLKCLGGCDSMLELLPTMRKVLSFDPLNLRSMKPLCVVDEKVFLIIIKSQTLVSS